MTRARVPRRFDPGASVGMMHGGALAAGLALGTTYVLSVGPNNMMIIREGLVRGRTILVASVTLATYVALLLMSYRMTDVLVARSAAVTTTLTGLGITAMIWFAVLSVRAARRPQARLVAAGDGAETLPACLRRVALVVVVNPLVYVEFLLIPSGALGTFKDPLLRLEFTVGLIVMAALACFGYAAGGRACAGLFRRPRAMQVFDLSCGCLLAILAVTIGLGLIRSLGA